MNHGVIEQMDEPDKLYGFPRNRLVADFIGNVNMHEATVAATCGTLTLELGTLGRIAAPSREGVKAGTGGVFVIRPEQVSIRAAAEASPDPNQFEGVVNDFLYIGDVTTYIVDLPEWASTLGMIFSVMLWAPSWGGMINGLLTLRGGWQKVVDDPILKFFVVGITAYGMSTFEGPMLSIKSVNALAHYTDWIIAHVHTGALGWNGFLTFGMVYWLLPRLFQAPLHSKKLAGLHFWIATFGIILYVVAIYSAGVTQGLMWRAFDETGRLMYPDFVETVAKLMPMYWVRVVGGSLYIVGMLLFGWNILMTWRARPNTETSLK